MSSSGNNPPSFRLPLALPSTVHWAVKDALQNHDDAITDLQQAIPYLKGSIESNTKAINAVGSTTGGGSENVVLSTAQPSPAANVIGTVNDQTGETSYTTTPSDYGAFVILNDAAAIAVTLATGTTIQTPWFATFINLGAGTATLTPETGQINGAASFSLPTMQATSVAYDGTNFWVEVYPTGASLTLTTTGTGGAASYSGGTLNIPVYASNPPFTLTTTGTSGAASFSGGTLNIPVYTGGGGGSYSLGGSLGPTNIALTSACGTGATVAISGLDGNHQVRLTTGTGVTPGNLFTVTFTTPRGNLTYPVIKGQTDNSLYSSGGANNAYTANTASTLASSTLYLWNVSCP